MIRQSGGSSDLGVLDLYGEDTEIGDEAHQGNQYNNS
jgi:hypothetical protein